MNRLTDDEVKHVAMLARLKLKDEEITTYAYKLKEIMDSIEKIKDIKLETDEMLVNPSEEICQLFTEKEEHLDKKDVLKNAKNKRDSYIAVRGVFND